MKIAQAKQTVRYGFWQAISYYQCFWELQFVLASAGLIEDPASK